MTARSNFQPTEKPSYYTGTQTVYQTKLSLTKEFTLEELNNELVSKFGEGINPSKIRISIFNDGNVYALYSRIRFQSELVK